MANCPERDVTLTDEVHLLKGTVGILLNVKGKFSFMREMDRLRAHVEEARWPVNHNLIHSNAISRTKVPHPAPPPRTPARLQMSLPSRINLASCID